jgi:hypothetical protein
LTARRFTRTVSFAHKQNLIAISGRRQPFNPVRSQTITQVAINIRNQHSPDGWRIMKTAAWKTYRTRFLVKAKQLSSALSFTDTLGRQHSGRKGDYLVESSDGVLRIAPRQIFEDIYVPMALIDEANLLSLDEPAPVRRKAPQPCRERHTMNSNLSYM